MVHVYSTETGFGGIDMSDGTDGLDDVKEYMIGSAIYVAIV